MSSLAYLRDPEAIYRQSFATVRQEARIEHLPETLRPLALRVAHASGMPDVIDDLRASDDLVESATAALAERAPILADCEMVRAGIIGRWLKSEISVTLNDPRTAGLASDLATTRSAAAVELWRDMIAGAVVVIGNAPTALFHLLERLDEGWPKPAAILAFPVGFVGAAESKAELARCPRGVPFVTLLGRRGGSAMASAALNALAQESAEGSR